MNTETSLLEVDVVILAYNEQLCIGDILQDIVRSNQSNVYRLQNILVISDASTDETDEIVQRFSQNDARVKLIRKSVRKGKSDSINLAFDLARSDILVLLDSDIRFHSENVLEYLVASICDKQAALTGGNIIPANPGMTFNPARLARYFDWVLEDELRKRKPTSYWSAYGRALALARDFYQNLKLPHSQADDLFIYYSCLINGYNFSYATDAIIYFEAPKSLRDYIRQFSRFGYYKEQARKQFGKELVDRDLMVHGMRRFLFLSLIRYPFMGFMWMICRALSRVAYIFGLNSSMLEQGLYKTESKRVEVIRNTSIAEDP